MKTCFKIFSLSIIVLTVVCLIAGPTSAETENFFFRSEVSEVIDTLGVLSGAGIVITPNQTVMKSAITVNNEAPLLDSGINCNDLGITDKCGIFQLDGFELSLDSYNLPSCLPSAAYNLPMFIRLYDRWEGCGSTDCNDAIAFWNRSYKDEACFPAWVPEGVEKIITEIRLYAADVMLWSGLAIPQDFYSAMKEMTMAVVARTYFVNANNQTVATIKYGFDTYSIDAAAMVAALAQKVIDLDLKKGISTSLDAKLSNALKSIDDLNQNNDVAAVSKLQAFINEVNAQIGTFVTDTEGYDLINDAQRIINVLSGM